MGMCCGPRPVAGYAPYGTGVASGGPYGPDLLPQPGLYGAGLTGPGFVPGTSFKPTPIPTAPLPTALTPPGGPGYGFPQPYPYHPPRPGQ
jgi:hypothetical protein